MRRRYQVYRCPAHGVFAARGLNPGDDDAPREIPCPACERWCQGQDENHPIEAMADVLDPEELAVGLPRLEERYRAFLQLSRRRRRHGKEWSP